MNATPYIHTAFIFRFRDAEQHWEILVRPVAGRAVHEARVTLPRPGSRAADHDPAAEAAAALIAADAWSLPECDGGLRGVGFYCVQAASAALAGHCWVELNRIGEGHVLLRFQDRVQLEAGLHWPPLRDKLGQAGRGHEVGSDLRFTIDPRGGTPQRRAPRLDPVCSVLVAGHRTERLPAEPDAVTRIENALETALTTVESALAGIPIDPHWAFTPDGETARWTHRITTGMADGVDAMARAFAARPPADGSRVRRELQILAVDDVNAPMPDATACAAFDVSSPETLRGPDERIFDARDEFALGLADCLIVVWDGKPAQGNLGGTVRLLHHAIQIGTPVLRVDFDGGIELIGAMGDPVNDADADRLLLDPYGFPHSGRMDDSVSAPAASAAVEVAGARTASPPIAYRGAEGLGLRPEDLGPALRQILCPHGRSAEGHGPAAADKPLPPAYFREAPAATSCSDPWAGWVHRLFDAVIRLDFGKLVSAIRGGRLVSRDAWLEPALQTADRDAAASMLEEAFRWSDLQATVNAGYHRSANVLLYLWSAVAVAAAVAGHLAGDHGHETMETAYALLECLALGMILRGVRQATLHQWHRRWLSHRYMAEQLRGALLLRPWLALPGWVTIRTAQDDTSRSFERWLLLRRLRGAGVPHRATLPFERPHMTAALVSRAVALFAAQVGYHDKTSKELGTLHRRMRGLATGTFVLTVVIVAFELVDRLRGGSGLADAVFFTAGLPALAAALHGIKEKLELERLDKQSRRMRNELRTLTAALESPRATMTPERDRDSHARARVLRLRELVRDGVNQMSDETSGWRTLLAVQESETP